MTNFAGRWLTTFGPMELSQKDGAIQGKYWFQEIPCTIAGKVDGERFVFRYQDTSGTGNGWFELISSGQFAGEYRVDGNDESREWTGQREWDGIWETTFGRMRLFQEDDQVSGFYDGVAPGRIEGQLDGQRFTFRYHEPDVEGEGWFDLADDALSFSGEWHPNSAVGSASWTGERVFAQPGLTWLVVLEAHWQRSLADREYSYGSMLKEFFARLPHVGVRQRYFNDEASLARWCREMMYIPEPAIVLISSHGLPEGVAVQGRAINTKVVIDGLQYANNIQLLHFAACLMLQEDNEGDFARRIETAVPYPISGYTTRVDWGGSAVLEFGYLDMILCKGIDPQEAANQLPTLITYAGDEASAESPYPAVGFRFIAPNGG